MSDHTIEHAVLRGSSYRDVDLAGAIFDDVNLHGARFSNVNLSRAVLENVNLSHTTITDACIVGLAISGFDVASLIKEAQTNRTR